MPDLAIMGGTVWDATGKPARTADLLISDGRIADIGPGIDLPKGCEKIEAKGQFVMPGLIDMHVHVTLCGEDSLLGFLGCGVTSIRDLGSDIKITLPMREALAKGERPGPRMFVHGPMIDGDPPIFGSGALGGLTWLVRNTDEARETLDKLIDEGVDGIKLYAGLRPDLVDVMIKHVNKRVPVAAHLGRTWASEAIASGVDTLEHVHATIYQDVVRSEDRHGREDGNGTKPTYWNWLSEGWSRADLEADHVKKFIEQIVENNVVLSPTTVLCTGGMATMEAAEEPGQKFRPKVMTDRMKMQREAMKRFQQMRAGSKDAKPAKQPGTDPAVGKKARDNQLLFLKKLFSCGGRIAPGTDTGAAPLQVPGFSMLRELALLVEGGIPHETVLIMSTKSSAQVLRRGDDLGTLEKGRIADVLVIDGNPLENIEDVRKLTHVIKDGKPHNPQSLLDKITVA